MRAAAALMPTLSSQSNRREFGPGELCWTLFGVPACEGTGVSSAVKFSLGASEELGAWV